MDSILNSIKKLLGIAEDYDAFDTDIIIDINSVFSILTQLGVGPKNGFSITDASATWDQFMPEDPRMNEVKSYMYMKVRLLFDPPTSSAAMASMEKLISEFEWRLNVAAETCDCE